MAENVIVALEKIRQLVNYKFQPILDCTLLQAEDLRGVHILHLFTSYFQFGVQIMKKIMSLA